jgi:hypothetical protein
MKTNVVLLAFLFISCLVSAQGNKDKKTTTADEKLPAITFDFTTHDYGTIPFNGDGTVEFKFTNTGKAPLILSNCQSSCGCTVPEWPKDPIPPKGKASIKVKYNTNRVGPFTKTVTVTSNAPDSPTVLTIKGTVEKQAEAGKEPVKEKSIISNEIQ